ncbi:MAG TPA: ribonuclease HII [Acidimicrobiales bacterium]
MSNSAVDLFCVERPLLARGDVVVGIDEVGRGAMAGPMTVGAVVLTCVASAPENLTDSKLLTPTRREELEVPLQRWAADWSLGSVSADEIDSWGLRLALAVAATRALDGLTVRPSHALVDGPFNLLRAPLDVPFGSRPPPELRYRSLPVTTIVKGDRKCASIAAASVLAKVHRDRLMVALHRGFEDFDWARNKGYGSKSHMDALRRFGPNDHHRRTWNLPERDVQEIA